MATALILYGPKAVGKSQIAHVLAERLGMYHLDPEELVPRLLAAGKRPDPRDGWLAEVAAHVQDALARHDLVSVEATGAWKSDWRLADELEAGGAGVCRAWISAPKEVALRRLRSRTTPRVSVSVDEASWIHDAATARARAPVSTSGSTPAPESIPSRWSRRCDHWLPNGRAGDGALRHGGKVQLTERDLPEAAMTDVDDFLAEIYPRLVGELRALHDGDPEPRLAMWSTREPVTLFGAGTSGRGREPVSRREDGEWKVVHRHGDQISIDQGQGLPGEASTT